MNDFGKSWADKERECFRLIFYRFQEGFQNLQRDCIRQSSSNLFN